MKRKTTDHLPMEPMSSEEVGRFWSKVNKQGSDECWNWQAGNCRGYGHFWLHGKTFKAARIALFVQTDRDPGDKQICHSCDNPSCCNAKHLNLGTSKDNNQDKTRKGRQAREEKHGRAKLTIKDVIAIKSSKQTTVSLAEEYGVGNSIIGKIQRGVLWPKIAPKLTRKSKRPGLTSDIVRLIRRSKDCGEDLAKHFGISGALVCLIRQGKIWKKVL